MLFFFDQIYFDKNNCMEGDSHPIFVVEENILETKSRKAPNISVTKVSGVEKI